jgi:hypothetical protein
MPLSSMAEMWGMSTEVAAASRLCRPRCTCGWKQAAVAWVDGAAEEDRGWRVGAAPAGGDRDAATGCHTLDANVKRKRRSRRGEKHAPFERGTAHRCRIGKSNEVCGR